MNLHQDMLMVPGEHEVIDKSQDGGKGQDESQGHIVEGQTQPLLDADALDLRTVKTELIEQAPDMTLSSQTPQKHAKTVKEALSRKKKGLPLEEGHMPKHKKAKSKKQKKNEDGKTKTRKGKEKGDGSGVPSRADPESNQSSMSAQSDLRPKYSLTSLIEALRDSIEKDKGKKGDGNSSTEDGSSDSDGISEESMSVQNTVCYDDLSPDSSSVGEGDSDSEGANDGDIQVSVKTFQVDGKTMYKCSLCSKVFSKTCTFARHAMVHSRMYPYQCGLCDEKCSDMRVLLRHLDWHGENVDCPCKKCERLHKYGEIKTLGEKSSGGSKFLCEICQRSFVSDVACKAHVNMHKRSGNLVCEVCNVTFQCNRALSKHRKSAHGIQFCPYCLETCTLDMASHMSEHEGVYMYRCGLCGDGYNSRPLLHEHLKIHTHLGKEFGQHMENEMKSVGISQRKVSTGRSSTELVKKVETPKVTKKEVKKVVKKNSVKTKTVKVKKEPKIVEKDIDEKDTVEETSGSPAKAPTKVLPTRQKTRKCRWHDNDSVCERCDVMFVKKIAFGRKPKSRQGKESPRQDDSNQNSNSVEYDGDDEKDNDLSKKDLPSNESQSDEFGEKETSAVPSKVMIPESLLRALVIPQKAAVFATVSQKKPAAGNQASSPQKSSTVLQAMSPDKASTLLQASAGSPQRASLVQLTSGSPQRTSLVKLTSGSPGKTVVIKTVSSSPQEIPLAHLELKTPVKTSVTEQVPTSADNCAGVSS